MRQSTAACCEDAKICIDLMNLIDFDVEVFQYLKSDPISAIRAFEAMIKEIQREIIAQRSDQENFYFRDTLPVSFCNFPLNSSVNIHELNLSAKSSRMIVICASILRVTDKKVLQTEQYLRCKKCGHQFFIYTSEDQFNLFCRPKLCPADECKGNKFTECEPQTPLKSTDYQEIKIQEQLNQLGSNKIPKSISVALYGNLVDTLKPGDQAVLLGILTSRWHPFADEKECELEVYIQVGVLVSPLLGYV